MHKRKRSSSLIERVINKRDRFQPPENKEQVEKEQPKYQRYFYSKRDKKTGKWKRYKRIAYDSSIVPNPTQPIPLERYQPTQETIQTPAQFQREVKTIQILNTGQDGSKIQLVYLSIDYLDISQIKLNGTISPSFNINASSTLFIPFNWALVINRSGNSILNAMRDIQQPNLPGSIEQLSIQDLRSNTLSSMDNGITSIYCNPSERFTEKRIQLENAFDENIISQGNILDYLNISSNMTRSISTLLMSGSGIVCMEPNTGLTQTHLLESTRFMNLPSTILDTTSSTENIHYIQLQPGDQLLFILRGPKNDGLTNYSLACQASIEFNTYS